MIPVALAVTAVVARGRAVQVVARRPRRRPMVWPVRTLSRSLPVVKGNRPVRAKVRVKAVDPAVVRELARVPVVVRAQVRAVLVPGWVLAPVVPVFLSAARPRLATRRRRPVPASVGRVQVWVVLVV